MSSYFIVITDAIDFHAPVKLGHIIHLTGRVTFTSKKSMEIEVVVDAKDYLAGMVLFFILKNKQYLPEIKPFKIILKSKFFAHPGLALNNPAQPFLSTIKRVKIYQYMYM